MSKELKIISCQPDDTYYTWQVHLWLESLKKIGYSDKAIVLLFTPKDRTPNPKWQQIIDLYPEAEFVRYDDDHQISNLISVYVPVLRPYVLWRYFKDHPKMVTNAVFYCDSDVIFNDNFKLEQFKDDNIVYLSDTNSYINAKYFDSKVNDVLPDKLESYKTRDVLAEVTSVIGINREICEINNDHSGGAQYFLKNIDASFWAKVLNDCIIIQTYLQRVNAEFFENESKGFQSWCADMWAVLWNLWLRNVETKVVPELEFAWAPDPISKMDTCGIYHNAGITGPIHNNYPCFFKSKYISGSDPFEDPHLQVVIENEESKKHCNWYYTKALIELKTMYNLNY